MRGNHLGTGSVFVLAIMGLSTPAWSQASSTATTSADAAPSKKQQTITSETPADAITPDRDASEIIVTARKRAESLQDVPLSVSVISGTRLQEQNITSIESLGQVTAGFVFRRTPNNLPNLTLRGLGTGTAIDAFEQSVATFIDGTYAGRGQEFNAALFDFDRVEVIRGAQASLLSKNTSLGAISLTTRKPGDRFKVDAVGSYELELGSYNLETGIDLPLSDTLQLRISGKYTSDHGAVRDVIQGNDVPHNEGRAGRIVAKFTPGEHLDLTLFYQHYRNRTRGIGWEGYSDPTGQVASLNRLGGFNGFTPVVDRIKGESSIYGQSYDHTHGNRAIGTLNFNFGEGFTLTSVTSYSDFDSNRFRDTDLIAGDYIDTWYQIGNRQFQEEVRLSSPAEGQAIDYVLGGSYYHEKWSYRDDQLSQCIGCSPAQLSIFTIRGRIAGGDDQTTRDLAAFAQVNVHATDTLAASGGIRYTNTHRDATLFRDVLIPGAFASVLYNGFPSTLLQKRENNVDGSIGLNWKPRTDLLLYVSASKGTKGGGFNNTTTNAFTPIGRALTEYQRETAKTYELGGKLSLPAGGFLNVTLFQTDISNFQQALFISPGFQISARDLRSRGFELESGVQLMPGLRANLQVAHADTRRRDLNRYHPPGAPKWSGNANLSFRQPLSNALSLSSDVGAEFRTSLFLTDENLTQGFNGNFTTNYVPRGQGYYYLNARVGLRSSTGWEAAVVGKNLNNKLVYTYGVAYTLIAPGAYVITNQPRTIALQLSYHY